MKLRASTKIAVGFVLAVGAVYLGYKVISDWMILREKFPEISPGRVTLLGIDPGSGYRIIVANDVAALVEGGITFGGEEGQDAEKVESDTRKKIPIRYMLEALQGDATHLGKFIMAINEMKEGGSDWPTNQVYWDAEDIRKALDGDPVLRKRLESDLNVKLDGTPLEVLRISAFQNGIVLRLPVQVKVMVAGTLKTMTGRVLEPYRPSFCVQLENQNLGEKMYNAHTILGFYIEMSTQVANGELSKENVAAALENRINQKKLDELAKAPTMVLSKAKIILNDSFVEGARLVEPQSDADRAAYRLVMNLNDEGRRRLWQYSKLHRGTQLLFVVNGTAIAAPVVWNEIPQAEVTITNLTSEDLAKNAVDTLNRHEGSKERKL